ncbi:Na/Pi cotransporter family protein [Salinarimonas soli]|uniref:Na/Pi cotransporter family protein n=1 Tax=Salinarimonas soli TaxID=1638099 RepID=A0A5B2VPZ0_9HYPH|nr:Na/Pi cotransporter family protein [Salinarimonas soli]KAA2241095.1 Na/Pi cotransporter family protein [Salinarimonas soli]
MSGTQVLFQLLGSVALLVWGVRLVRTGVTRALGTELRRLISLSSRNRFAAFASGIGVTGLLQSSTATALIVGSFAGRGLIALPIALAIMLGADVGSTLVAQLLAFDIKWLWSALVAAAVLVFMSREGERPRGIARAVLGLGLMLLALKELGDTTAVLKDSPLLRAVLGDAGIDPVIGFLLAAVLTWAAHSSLSVVLFIMSLAVAGVVATPLALVLVLGANLGGAFAPWLMLSGSPPAARRVPLGNLILRGLAAVAAIPLAWRMGEAWRELVADPGQSVVLFHMTFNLAVAVLGLGLTGPLARLLLRVQPDRLESGDIGVPRHLDPSVLDTPSEALACAMRETLRLGDQVNEMLRLSLAAIEGNDPKRVKDVEKADDAVDRLHEAIKLYLVRASRAEMSDDESRRFVEILTFTTNLEHIGDIIDKNLMELAAKKIRRQLSFSPEGAGEIRAFHAHLEETMRLALNVFATRDISLARRLFAVKSVTRSVERNAAESHFTRLRNGRTESIETSAIHLDILRDFKRIHGHLTSVAYPILEAEGELSESRLRERSHADLPAILPGELGAGLR